MLAERDLIEEALLKAKSELFTVTTLTPFPPSVGPFRTVPQLLDEQERVELASRCVYVSLEPDQVITLRSRRA